MSEPKDYNIDEILAKYGNYSTVKKDWDKFEESEQFEVVGGNKIMLDELKAQLFELITKEIIEDDEPASVTYKRNPRILQQKVANPMAIARNKLRQTQRQKLSDLFIIKER